MIDSVVDLFEEHVDLGGSQFSESIVERWFIAPGVGWKNFACRAISPSGCQSTFERNSFVHSCFSEIFGGGRGDMLTFSYKTSPVFSLTTFGIQ